MFRIAGPVFCTETVSSDEERFTTVSPNAIWVLLTLISAVGCGAGVELLLPPPPPPPHPINGSITRDMIAKHIRRKGFHFIRSINIADSLHLKIKV